MSFDIYPDTATAALLGKPASAPISLTPTEAMRRFVPLADHAGPDPAVGNVPTAFIRIAVSGAPPAAAMQPKFELLAHDPDRPGGSAAPPLDPNTAVGVSTAVVLFDDVNSTGAALAYFSPPFLDNVYLLKVVIEIPGTRLWLRITNTTGIDPDDEPRSFVWAVADSDADARQPWIHATFNGAVPARINFNALVGQTSATTSQPIDIINLGTGPCTVDGTTPALTSPFAISGLPARLNPHAPATVNVGFNAPSTPGDTQPSAFSFTTSDHVDPGPFGAGHNGQFILSAHTSVLIWTSRAPMPTRRAGLGLAGAANGKIYAAGGFTEGAFTLPTLEEYDPATNVWTTKRAMPTGRSLFGFAAARNGKLYAVGGRNQEVGGSHSISALNIVEEYDPATDTWTTKTPMPTARASLGLVVAGNGRLYAVGGEDNGLNALTVTEEYDPATNMWATKAPIPTVLESFGFEAAGNGKLYAVGGIPNISSMVAVEEYDPATNAWTSKAPMPTGRSNLGLAAARNGKLYAVGGNGLGPALAVVEEYDPVTNSWASRPPMPTPRSLLGLTTASNGKLYACGGIDFHNALSTAMEECTF